MARKLAIYMPAQVAEIDLDFRPEKMPARKPRVKAERTVKGNPDEAILSVNPFLEADVRLNFPNPSGMDSSNNGIVRWGELGKVAIDTETTGLRYRFGDMPWMVSMAESGASNLLVRPDGKPPKITDRQTRSWCGLWPVDPYSRKVLWQENEFYTELKAVVEDPYIVKTYFNRWFDIRMLATVGIIHRGDSHDVSLMARVYRTDEFAYKLKPLSHRYLGLNAEDEKELKAGIQKCQRKARKLGFSCYEIPESASKSKQDKAAPDYWLSMYAHVLFPEDPVFVARIKMLAEEYCRKDTLRTVLMDDFYTDKFSNVEAYRKFYQVEQEIALIVDGMETNGVRAYPERTEELRKKCIADSEVLLTEIRAEAGEDFDPESSTQYSKFLFTPTPFGLGLEPTEKTPTGQYKTGNRELAKHSGVPFVQKVTQYKANNKAVSLFFDKYAANTQYDEKSGYWYLCPGINQGNTKTFRFSMSEPNLQQASSPETSAKGANVIPVRGCFGPRPDYFWWLYDYSGQELKVLGGLMGIRLIHDAVKNGDDIPTRITNEIWGGKNNETGLEQAILSLELYQAVPSNEHVAAFWQELGWYPGKLREKANLLLLADQALAACGYDFVKLEKLLGKKVSRTLVKNTIYATNYGAGIDKIALTVGCTKAKAEEIRGKLYTTMPELKAGTQKLKTFAETHGYIETMFGRRISCDADSSYKAVNYAVQGTSADMMKISMLRCHKYTKQTGLDSKMVLSIHDELIFETHKKHSYPWYLRGIKTLMEDHMAVLGIHVSTGLNRVTERWDEEEGFSFDARGNVIRDK